MDRTFLQVFIILLCPLWLANAQTFPGRYTLILEDAPLLQQFDRSTGPRTKEAIASREQIQAKQKALTEELVRRKFQVTGAVSTLMNAVFVIAPPERADELKTLPGVKAVVPGRRYHRSLNRATELLDAPAAWNALGGIQSAGSGMKIAILDSGIDQTHPALQDNTLSMPQGFPICSGSDCAFTNNKVIVARSYVRQLAAGSSPNPAADSRPDDYSPRDRVGHGTAVASCAAGNLNTGLVMFSGFAPKAWLGNYKIYGSPGVNDGSSDDLILQALDDAYQDGMDVISLSSGAPSFSGPLDTGTVCGNDPGVACDLVAQAVESLSAKGVVIVTAAGNEGNDGVSTRIPGYSTIDSPGSAPSAIAVGAATNSHSFTEVVGVSGSGVPSNVQNIPAEPGDGFLPTGAITGRLVDVRSLGNDGYACSTLPAGSLVGAIVLIKRDNCDFSVKGANAEDAGAMAIVFYMSDASPVIAPGGLSGVAIPATMISNASGTALASWAAANPTSQATIDPAGVEQNATPGQVTIFSSLGPTTGTAALKPDLLAIGENVYMAGQSYDFAGELYSSNGYVLADGTSFSTPMVAGAAALVKQRHPNWTAAQIKSALVNTAASSVQTDEAGNPVDNRSFGGGLLDVGNAVNTWLTATPSNVSFGILTSASLSQAQQIQFTNSGTSTLNLSITVAPAVSGSAPRIDRASVTINPNTTGTLNVSPPASLPSPGAYSGNIVVQASGVSLHIPYLYTIRSSTAANIIPLTGMSFDGTVGQGIADGIISILLTDASGAPIAGAPVSFSGRGGSISQADSTTDNYGIAAAVPVLGSQPGGVTYTATAAGLRATFSGFARPRPTLSSSGAANAASGQAGAPVAPGSYISLFGNGLSDFTDFAQTARLPLAIDQAFVSFDVPSAGISVPGHLTYVSPSQLNVQVPWELQGQGSAQVKVTIDYSNGNLISVPISNYAPAFFHGSDGTAAALDQQNAVVTSSNPAHRGQIVQLFANGLGPVTNQPASGEPAPSSPTANTTATPTVMIGGQPAAVVFSGLAPGFAGLYQVNATVPAGLSPGTQQVTVSIGGTTSPAVNLPVQ